MSEEKRNKSGRREFLKTSAGIAVMTGCFTRLELKEALAQARVSGKPLLTEANINLHCAFSATAPPKRRNHQTFVQQVREFKSDSRGYLTKHFQATPNQLKEFESLNRNSMDDLFEALDRCVRERLPFQVKILRGGSSRASILSAPLQLKLASASSMPKLKQQVECDDDKCTVNLSKIDIVFGSNASI